MTKTEIRVEQGYCPESEANHRVEVRFLIAQTLGGINFPPKFDSTKCRDDVFCNFVKEHGYCPLQDEIVAKYS